MRADKMLPVAPAYLPSQLYAQTPVEHGCDCFHCISPDVSLYPFWSTRIYSCSSFPPTTNISYLEIKHEYELKTALNDSPCLGFLIATYSHSLHLCISSRSNLTRSFTCQDGQSLATDIWVTSSLGQEYRTKMAVETMTKSEKGCRETWHAAC